MRRDAALAAVLLLAVNAWGQNTAIYPGATASCADMLLASNLQAATTTLTSALGAADTTISVASTTAYNIPAGCATAITIDQERIKVCSKTATTFTVCTGGRGFDGSTAASHANGATVRANIVAWYPNQRSAEITAIETDLAAKLPTQGQKDALPGTSGAPGATNKYVTNADSRNSDARAPTAHATSHQNGGSDQVAVAAAAANAIPKAGAGGRLAVGWEPIIVSTADVGYFQGVSIWPTVSTGLTAVFAANQVKVWQFVLPFAVTVGKITFDVTTGSGVCGGTCSAQLGLWTSDLATVAVATGVMTSGGAPNINAVARYTVSVTAVTLNPGVYNLVMTTDSAVLVLRAIAIGSSAINPLNDQTVKKWGTCANAGAAGVFPASCGAVTATTAVPPLVTFER